MEYSCRFTWNNRSVDDEKMKSNLYYLSAFGNDRMVQRCANNFFRLIVVDCWLFTDKKVRLPAVF